MFINVIKVLKRDSKITDNGREGDFTKCRIRNAAVFQQTCCLHLVPINHILTA